MVDFYHRRFDILLCTTIIETGIDIPTRQHHHHQPRRPLRPGAAAPAARPRRPLAPPRLCLPDRADAQGDRPGRRRSAWKRSSRWKNSAPASCWPRTTWRSAAPASCSARPERRDDRSRLDPVPGHAGSRGASAMKAGARARWTRRLPRTEVELHVPALLPDDYVADVHARLALYKRIASAADEPAMDDLSPKSSIASAHCPNRRRTCCTARACARRRRLGVRRTGLRRRRRLPAVRARRTASPSRPSSG